MNESNLPLYILFFVIAMHSISITVTFLVLPEQAKVLAELEQVAKLHLALVYRGTTDGAKQFIEAQDALIEELYAEPEEEPVEEGEAADPTAEMPESEVTG